MQTKNLNHAFFFKHHDFKKLKHSYNVNIRLYRRNNKDDDLIQLLNDSQSSHTFCKKRMEDDTILKNNCPILKISRHKTLFVKHSQRRLSLWVCLEWLWLLVVDLCLCIVSRYRN